MMFDYEAAKFWLELVLIFINLGLWIFVWNSNKSRVTAERIRALENDIESRLETHTEKLGRMDERLKKAIGHSELGPVFDRLNSMDRRLSEMSGKMHTLDLIHEFLMNGGRNK